VSDTSHTLGIIISPLNFINTVMNNNCWYRLNLSTENSIRSDFEFDFSKRNIHRIETPNKILTSDWINYLKRFDLEPFHIMIFYKTSKEYGKNKINSVAHTDGKCRTFAINWTLSGHNGEMVWYLSSDKETNKAFTAAKTPFYGWPTKELIEIDRCSIDTTPTLVRINYPHNIEVKDEARLSISIRTSEHKFNFNWDNVKDHLRHHNLLIER